MFTLNTPLLDTYHPIKFHLPAMQHVTCTRVNNLSAEVPFVPCGTRHVHGTLLKIPKAIVRRMGLDTGQTP